jgi:hypothetical protein
MAGAAGPGMAPAPAFLSTIRAQIIRADDPVSLWGTHWLGYTRWDGIVVTADDVAELRRGSRDARAVLAALWQYAEAGGSLVILGPGKPPVPASWKRFTAQLPGFTVYRPGFGECLVSADRDHQKWDEPRWNALNASWSQTAAPWQSARTLTEVNRAFPVVDSLGVPVRGLFVLMILFAIAIGPLNVWFLARKKKRIWMLWTVPVLSTGTCLLVFGYMLLAEGWYGRARVDAFTILDESEHRATTIGRNAFYSPLTPSAGLHYSTDTEVFTQALGFPGRRATGTSRTLDWGADQHLASGWVSARVPAHFLLRKSEPRRERVSIAAEGGALTAVNGLGAEIQTLWVADARGRVYTAGPVPAGAKVTLEPARQTVPRERSTDMLRQVYGSSDWSGALSLALEKPEELLAPRTYLAVLDSSPFLEQGLARARLRGARGVVLGLMGEPDAR